MDMAAAAPTSVTEFRVSGMTCQNCARHVTEAIQSVASVASASVDLDSSTAIVRWKSEAVATPEAVAEAVQAAGYHATIAEQDHVASATSNWSPFRGWKFNVYAGGAATLILMIGEWALQAGMAVWFHWLGFLLALPVQVLCGARFYRGAWSQLKAGSSNMDTLVALGSTTAFAFSAWGLFTGWHGHLYFMEAAAIITLISVGHWAESLASARAASSLRALMNLAPAKARKLVFPAAPVAPITPANLLGGSPFSAKQASSTSPFDKRFSTGKPTTPISPAVEIETEVPVAELHPGDRVVLKPGDRIPVDGVVLDGGSAVDESMLTGESLPVEKTGGSQLYAGTVNQDGRLIMRVEATGETTALATIIAVVQRAQTSRANIQRLGDRVSSVFVPIVVVLAILSGLWWGLNYEGARHLSESLAPWLWMVHVPATALAAAFIQAAAVLIVACPCAMGLATPAAIMAGTNAAARRGILIRDGEALEKSGTITAVVFDKTGTLTAGSVTVAGVIDLRLENDRGVPLERLAAALARPSNHPLSRAVAKLEAAPIAASTENDVSPGNLEVGRAVLCPPLGEDRSPTGAHGVTRPTITKLASSSAPADRIAVQEWQEVRGSGVMGRLLGGAGPHAGALVRLGSLGWLRASGVTTEVAEGFVQEQSARGATVLGVATGTRLLGVIALRDALDSGATAVLRKLIRSGQKVYLLTGDNRRAATAIAQQAGIAPENVFAEVRPEQKSDIVKQLQQRGERVAFVGDGINDAPALEQADLGIAVSRASDVAREAADIILLKSDLNGIPEALGLAQATLRTIKQNLFWAFFYNAAAVPLAMLGFLSPVICAAAMGVSDVIVIGNALRLLRWKSRRDK